MLGAVDWDGPADSRTLEADLKKSDVIAKLETLAAD
jgi:hypothetical protein